MDTQLRNLLHDLATEMPVDVEGGAPRTLRRARGRRILTAGAGVAIVAALVVVSVSALRFGGEPTTTPAVIGPKPQPAGFEGLWPETDAEALAATQAAVDDGHQPLRTTADGTASLLAVDLLGWRMPDVQIESTTVDGNDASVVISNRIFGDPVPPVTIELRQLGDTGPIGAWSVVGVSEPPLELPALIEVDDITELSPEVPEIMPGALLVSGRVTDLFEGAPAIEAHVFDGPSLLPSLGSSRDELTDLRFSFRFSVEPTPDGEATMLLTMPDATGASLGALMTSVQTPIGDPPSTGVDVTGVPPDVAVTAQGIYDGARARDFDALAQLLDPNTFAYNFDDGSDPLPAWRQDPSVLDLMVAVLELPPAAARVIEGYGTFTIWPYLIDSDFDTLSQRERDDLAALGYSDADIQLMIEGGHGYQGPRLAIDETGLWRNFTTVGE
jgi:hypothetical protein